MIFTDDGVNLPERLLESLTNDRLVIFVGAGVSMRAYKEQPEDTYYPGFKELATLIANRLSRTVNETEQVYLENGYIDRLLGEWDDQRCDVRNHAAGILQRNEEGQRLELHRAIIRLFATNPISRIITTNLIASLFVQLIPRVLRQMANGISVLPRPYLQFDAFVEFAICTAALMSLKIWFLQIRT